MTDTDDQYIAYIYEPEIDDQCLTAVDIRTLDVDRLLALRAEAGAAGDATFVATIDSVVGA